MPHRYLILNYIQMLSWALLLSRIVNGQCLACLGVSLSTAYTTLPTVGQPFPASFTNISPNASSHSSSDASERPKTSTKDSGDATHIGESIANTFGIAKTQPQSSLFSTSRAPTVSRFIRSTNSVESSLNSESPGQSQALADPNVQATTPQSWNRSSSGTVNIDECWTQWLSHWSLLSNMNIEDTGTAATSSIITTGGRESLVVDSWLPWTSARLVTLQVTYTHVLQAHGFVLATSMETDSELETVTGTIIEETIAEPTNLLTPSCVLPSLVPDCQSKWDAFETSQLPLLSLMLTASEPELDSALDSAPYNPPDCSQASVGPALCAIIRKAAYSYQTKIFDFDGELGAYQQISTHLSNSSTYVTTSWPASSNLAPGCSLGCASCQITGGTVRLFYWPAPQIATGASPLTVSALGTNFTSPTVYVSYKSLYASNSCSGIGKLYTNTIIAVPNSSQISSIWGSGAFVSEPYPGSQYSVSGGTASFNFTDLNTPVPRSIYERQPQCAMQYYMYGLQDQEHIHDFKCNITTPYAPIGRKDSCSESQTQYQDCLLYLN